MSTSRKRRPSKRQREALFEGPLALGRLFEGTVEKYYDIPPPPVLYHYTTWAGASGILSEQRFWATAHDCTNDPAELASANAVIVEAASEQRKLAIGAAAAALDMFLEGYPNLQVSKVLTACLVCFSTERDDVQQWKKYADDGRGMCLGLRVLNEPPPTDQRCGLVKVEYSENAWRDIVMKAFREICSVLSLARVSRQNVVLGAKALYRIATHASISAKRPEWAVEREYRLVTLVYDDDLLKLKEREFAGKTRRYLPVPVRVAGRRIALAEILIGPNQNAEDARERLTQLLASNGYMPGSLEYPEIMVSSISPWTPPMADEV